MPSSKSSMSPSSAVSIPVLDKFVVQSPRPQVASEAVIVESVDGPIAPNTANLLRDPVEGPMGSYTNSNARQQQLAMWRAREPVRVNISPRARWSSSSEGRRKKTIRFPAARMRDRTPTPRAIVTYPRLRPPPVVPARERDWVRMNIPADNIQQYREEREGIDFSPISPSSADLRRYMEDRSLWDDSSRSRSRSSRSRSSRSRSSRSRSSRSRSSSSRRSSRSRSSRSRSSRSRSPRRVMVRINPPGIGRVLKGKNHSFQHKDKEQHKHWRRTKKALYLDVPTSSSPSSSSSSRHS